MNFGASEIVIILVLLPVFFLPIIIAVKKNHQHKIPIILINILGGWLWGIGWLVALIWCFIEPSDNNNSTITTTASEIEKLHELMKKGVITQEEFETKKKAFLEI